VEGKEKRELAIACTSSVPFSKHRVTRSSLKQEYMMRKTAATETESREREKEREKSPGGGD
jgi:hypothetical protein